LLAGSEQLEEAEQLLRECLAAQRETSGPFHAETLSTLTSLGEVMRRRGRLEEAEELLGPAYVAASDQLGATSALVRPLARLFAAVLRERGQADEALAIETATR
jgi:tetratricopeptide (TPR) repeat protein